MLYHTTINRVAGLDGGEGDPRAAGSVYEGFTHKIFYLQISKRCSPVPKEVA